VLNAKAARQAGYFTARQAGEVGYSYQAQKYHVDHGNWTRVGRGLFRLPDWPATNDDQYVLWLLWSGDRAVVSHESALALHDLSDVNPHLVHLTVPLSFRAQAPDVVLHRATLPAGDIEDRAPIRVTTVARTLLDVAAGDLGQEQLDVAVADALERGLISARSIRERSDDHGGRATLRIERSVGAART
jgi:predicted transcriptional regulator of viral defense system